MSTKLTVKQGDLKPIVVAVLEDETEAGIVPFDLSAVAGATVTAHIENKAGDAWSAACSIVEAAAGRVSFALMSEHTGAVDVLKVEFRVVGTDSKPRTFPAAGYLQIVVQRKLGG